LAKKRWEERTDASSLGVAGKGKKKRSD